MTSMAFTCFMSSLLLAGQISAGAPGSPLVVNRCLVSLIDEVHIPAKETGQLMMIPVSRGDVVAKGDLLAQIDDSIPKKQREIAKLRFMKAAEQATNEVDIKYAAKAAEVAKEEHEMLVKSNEGVRGSIAAITVRKAFLGYERAVLQAEQAALTHKVAGMTADEARGEMEAAEMIIENCRTPSPIDGTVVQLFKQEGEWVRPGEPLMRIVGLNRLKVEGTLDADLVSQSDILHRKVTMVVRLATGPATFTGHINFVSPEIGATGEFDISAELQNRQDDHGFWMLLPGEVGDLTIHLDQAPVKSQALAERNR